MTHVLTDNGSCFTQAFAKVCAELGAAYRHIKPRTPQTNGMVERFNGRIVAEVLAITVYSHDQLEQLLRGFNAAYNARRQRVLEGQTPDQVVAERLIAKPALAQDKPSGRAGPCDITKARLIAENAKGVSQPDTPSVIHDSLAFDYNRGRRRHALATWQSLCAGSAGAGFRVSR
jgi:transposase InsO family protein